MLCNRLVCCERKKRHYQDECNRRMSSAAIKQIERQSKCMRRRIAMCAHKERSNKCKVESITLDALSTHVAAPPTFIPVLFISKYVQQHNMWEIFSAVVSNIALRGIKMRVNIHIFPHMHGEPIECHANGRILNGFSVLWLFWNVNGCDIPGVRCQLSYVSLRSGQICTRAACYRKHWKVDGSVHWRRERTTIYSDESECFWKTTHRIKMIHSGS